MVYIAKYKMYSFCTCSAMTCIPVNSILILQYTCHADKSCYTCQMSYVCPHYIIARLPEHMTNSWCSYFLDRVYVWHASMRFYEWKKKKKKKITAQPFSAILRLCFHGACFFCRWLFSVVLFDRTHGNDNIKNMPYENPNTANCKKSDHSILNVIVSMGPVKKQDGQKPSANKHAPWKHSLIVIQSGLLLKRTSWQNSEVFSNRVKLNEQYVKWFMFSMCWYW